MDDNIVEYRYTPFWRMGLFGAGAVFLMVCAGVATPGQVTAAYCCVAGAIGLAGAGLMQRRTILRASADELVIMRTSFLPLAAKFVAVGRDEILSIRYRREEKPIPDTDAPDTIEEHYYLDVRTRNRGIINLLHTSVVTFDSTLGRQMAERLRVKYEEFLEE